ncbi:MAG: DUF4857 domain-containing protein [Planctomycetota bacterium]
MIRLSRTVIILLVVAVSAFLLPELYWKAMDQKVHRPFILYSAILDRFMTRTSDDFGQTTHADETGKEYDRIEFEKLTPFFNYRNLMKWELLPVEVKGSQYDDDLIRTNMQVLRLDPNDLHTPQIDLYPLYESASLFAQLENPPDMFRLTESMEFIVASSNEVDEEKSALFTSALRGEGFQFPARYVAGNPTTRKPFDEGYIAVDASGTLFHIKMVEGRPWCVNTGVTPAAGVRLMSLSENSRREFYGTLISGDDKVHLISYDSYRLIPLPTVGYEPDRMGLQLYADPLNRTIIFKDLDEDLVHCVLTDRDYNAIRTWDCPVKRADLRLATAAGELLFPFRFVNTHQTSDYVLFSVEFGGGLAWLGILLSLLTLALIRFKRPVGPAASWIDWVIVALTGFYGLIAVIIVGREPSRG